MSPQQGSPTTVASCLLELGPKSGLLHPLRGLYKCNINTAATIMSTFTLSYIGQELTTLFSKATISIMSNLLYVIYGLLIFRKVIHYYDISNGRAGVEAVQTLTRGGVWMAMAQRSNDLSLKELHHNCNSCWTTCQDKLPVSYTHLTLPTKA